MNGVFTKECKLKKNLVTDRQSETNKGFHPLVRNRRMVYVDPTLVVLGRKEKR